VCFEFLYNFCLNISHSKTNLARCCHICENFMQNTSFLSNFNEIWILSTNIREPKYEISSKYVPWESRRSMWTAIRTDMKTLIVAFRSFAIKPEVPANTNMTGNTAPPHRALRTLAEKALLLSLSRYTNTQHHNQPIRNDCFAKPVFPCWLWNQISLLRILSHSNPKHTACIARRTSSE
jgi:hypothetical protein